MQDCSIICALSAVLRARAPRVQRISVCLCSRGQVWLLATFYRPMLLRAPLGLQRHLKDLSANRLAHCELQVSCEALHICTVSKAELRLQGLDIVREHENLRFQRGEGPRQPKGRSVDLSQLSLQDTNEEEVRL